MAASMKMVKADRKALICLVLIGPKENRVLIVELDEAYERLCRGDLASLEACWRWRTGLLGQHVLIECQDGNHRGRLRELSWDALILEQAKGEPLCLRPEMVKHVTRLSGK